MADVKEHVSASKETDCDEQANLSSKDMQEIKTLLEKSMEILNSQFLELIQKYRGIQHIELHEKTQSDLDAKITDIFDMVYKKYGNRVEMRQVTCTNLPKAPSLVSILGKTDQNTQLWIIYEKQTFKIEVID